jgi:hypothetical protein
MNRKRAGKLLEPPQPGGWRPRFWRIGATVALAAILVVCFWGAWVWGQMSGQDQMRAMGQMGGAAETFILSGNKYLSKDDAMKLGYVSGVIDAFFLISASQASASGPPNLGWLAGCTNKMNNIQIQAIVDKYMKDNPQIWHEPMAAAVLDAMMRACGQNLEQ